MTSKAAARRSAAAARLAQSARLFYPDRVDQFLCPTCLTWVALSEEDRITEAHIVPDAAGGRTRTVLCRRCNSLFGTGRDKWLGEYIRLFRNDNPTVLHAEAQKGYFFVDDVRVTGRYSISENGPIEFTIFEDHTSRDAINSVLRRFADARGKRGFFPPGPVVERPSEWTVRVPVPPLLENQHLVTLGFLTAAYLMWFRELGYSWALQHHLNSVREQIQTDSLSVLPRSFCGDLPERVWDGYWLGFGRVNGELALLAGIERRVVLFPPVDSPDFYSRLPRSLDGVTMEVLGRVRFGPHFIGGGPCGVVYDGRLVVSPDVFSRGRRFPLVVVPAGNGPLQVLYPISREEGEALKRRHPDRGLLLRTRLTPTEHETGR